MKKKFLTLILCCFVVTLFAQQPISPAIAIKDCPVVTTTEYASFEDPSTTLYEMNMQWSERVSNYQLERIQELKRQINTPDKPAEKHSDADLQKLKDFSDAVMGMVAPYLNDDDYMKLAEMNTKGVFDYINKKLKANGKTPPNPADFGLTEAMMFDSQWDEKQDADDFGEEYSAMENQMDGYHEQYQRQVENFRQQAYQKMKAVQHIDFDAIRDKLRTQNYGKGESPYTDAQYEAWRKELNNGIQKYKEDLYRTWTEYAIRPAQTAMLEYNDILLKWEAMQAKMYKLNLETYQQAWGDYGYTTLVQESSRAWSLYSNILFHAFNYEDFLNK